MKRYLEPKDSLTRYAKINPLNLQAVEEEIDLLISLAGDDVDDRTFETITSLIKLAKALGTKRSW